MNYRDLIDIPEIEWTPLDERLRNPPRADAQRAILTPSNRKSVPRNVGRSPKPATPVEKLEHREPECTGSWRKKSINKFGHQVVECGKCGATRIAKREAE